MNTVMRSNKESDSYCFYSPLPQNMPLTHFRMSLKRFISGPFEGVAASDKLSKSRGIGVCISTGFHGTSVHMLVAALLLASERVKDRSLETVRWMIVVLPPPPTCTGDGDADVGPSVQRSVLRVSRGSEGFATYLVFVSLPPALFLLLEVPALRSCAVKP